MFVKFLNRYIWIPLAEDDGTGGANGTGTQPVDDVEDVNLDELEKSADKAVTKEDLDKVLKALKKERTRADQAEKQLQKIDPAEYEALKAERDRANKLQQQIREIESQVQTKLKTQHQQELEMRDKKILEASTQIKSTLHEVLVKQAFHEAEGNAVDTHDFYTVFGDNFTLEVIDENKPLSFSNVKISIIGKDGVLESNKDGKPKSAVEKAQEIRLSQRGSKYFKPLSDGKGAGRQWLRDGNGLGSNVDVSKMSPVQKIEVARRLKR